MNMPVPICMHMATVATIAWSYLDLLETEFLFITRTDVGDGDGDDNNDYGTVPLSPFCTCFTAMEQSKNLKYFSRFVTIDLLLSAMRCISDYIVYSWRVFAFFNQIAILFFSSFLSRAHFSRCATNKIYSIVRTQQCDIPMDSNFQVMLWWSRSPPFICTVRGNTMPCALCQALLVVSQTRA